MIRKKLFNAILRRYFPSFLHKSFITINPTKPFYHNWHISLISDYLQLIEQGKIKRLIINVPPRTLKSTCINVAWTSWLLGQDPSKRIISASYSMQLSIKHSMDCQAIINSEWYQEIFQNTIINKSMNNKKKFITTQHGFRMTTSVGGSITGEGADIIIVDDPHNPTYIHSKKIRNKVIHWYENTLVTRLNDPSKGAIVIIMQRLHENDLHGHIVAKDKNHKWTILSIPAIAEESTNYISHNKKYIFTKGTSIQEKHLPIVYLQQLKNEIGQDTFNAQYQQNPNKNNLSGLLPYNLIQFYDDKPKELKLIIQSWDTAFKTKEQNDYSVCTTWGISSNNAFFLLDLYINRINYPDLKSTIIRLNQQFKANIVIIEDHANGQSLIQDLKINQQMHNIVSVNHKINKFSRFASILNHFYEKKVLFPKNNLLVQNELIPQITSFPNCKHDDIVDSISQFLIYQNSNLKKTILIREL